ncbi:MAG: HAD family phosphatase [Vicinamibacterales bacterium]
MDGLMVDTEPLYKTAWQAATAELGYDLDDRLYATIVGRPLPDCERTLMDAFGGSFPLEALRARWPRLWRDEVERVGIQMKPGLPELLAFADARGLCVAVATSTNADWASFTLTRVGLADRFDVVVTGDRDRARQACAGYLPRSRTASRRSARCLRRDRGLGSRHQIDCTRRDARHPGAALDGVRCGDRRCQLRGTLAPRCARVDCRASRCIRRRRHQVGTCRMTVVACLLLSAQTITRRVGQPTVEYERCLIPFLRRVRRRDIVPVHITNQVVVGNPSALHRDVARRVRHEGRTGLSEQRDVT